MRYYSDSYEAKRVGANREEITITFGMNILSHDSESSMSVATLYHGLHHMRTILMVYNC